MLFIIVDTILLNKNISGKLNFTQKREKDYIEMNNNKEETLIAEFWFEAVKQGKIDFQDVPKEYMSTELCLEAVKQNPQTFQDVPSVL